MTHGCFRLIPRPPAFTRFAAPEAARPQAHNLVFPTAEDDIKHAVLLPRPAGPSNLAALPYSTTPLDAAGRTLRHTRIHPPVTAHSTPPPSPPQFRGSGASRCKS
ncbi:hypothetical protein T440DRAFT_207434 [Plenodomus tracheiphilus IPT5]|uniref:Uncharacterized protein n=1 Tax=Plenodomus tracheiphilus IPT5 TaxID=1408161 RepID=A0A6A7BJ05_9PLEO|nr:hypothetical protein T440DRAFT_207434 [Plenodomus tracheiphilus IPT5]